MAYGQVRIVRPARAADSARGEPNMASRPMIVARTAPAGSVISGVGSSSVSASFVCSAQEAEANGWSLCGDPPELVRCLRFARSSDPARVSGN